MPPAFIANIKNLIAQYKSQSLYRGVQVVFIVYAPPYHFQSDVRIIGIQSLF
jgi:hypothetical protein